MNSKLVKNGIIVTLLSLIVVSFFILGGNTTNTAMAANSSSGEISVGGTGVVRVKPDMAVISIGIETTHKDSKIAQEDNTKRSNQMIDALNQAGIKKEDIKTAYYHMYQERQYNPQDGKTTDGNFRVSHNLEITVNDIEKVGAIIDVATKNGATQVNGVSFTVSDVNQYYQEALKLALQDADMKAKTIADTLAVKIGKPSKVTENSYNTPVFRGKQMNYDMLEQSSPELSIGEMEIRADLQVNYHY